MLKKKQKTLKNISTLFTILFTARVKSKYFFISFALSNNSPFISLQTVSMLGRSKYYERVEEFKFEYSNDGRNFQTYQEGGKDKVD